MEWLSHLEWKLQASGLRLVRLFRPHNAHSLPTHHSLNLHLFTIFDSVFFPRKQTEKNLLYIPLLSSSSYKASYQQLIYCHLFIHSIYLSWLRLLPLSIRFKMLKMIRFKKSIWLNCFPRVQRDKLSPVVKLYPFLEMNSCSILIELFLLFETCSITIIYACNYNWIMTCRCHMSILILQYWWEMCV